MTILNTKQTPVTFDPNVHVDTQLVEYRDKDRNTQRTWGIKAVGKAFLARRRDNPAEAQWVCSGEPEHVRHGD